MIARDAALAALTTLLHFYSAAVLFLHAQPPCIRHACGGGIIFGPSGLPFIQRIIVTQRIFKEI
jgi:hypothetical protein